jgi:release factor glutamine methyltransferase
MSAATWRALRSEVAAQLSDAGIIPAESEARFLVEAASGYDADEWLEIADTVPVARAAARLHDMVDRRVTGEPLQYVIGAWSFRDLDLFVDKRVLIPRPETEILVEVALEEAERLGLKRGPRRRLTVVEPERTDVIVDLGTGSGAIAIALEAELPDVEVWATDASEDALKVARANVAGCAAARVRIAPPGDWFDALPRGLRGKVRLIVSNPPYVAEHEVASLPEEVADYEPRRALVSGALGTEALEAVLAGACTWLGAGGTTVLELAPHQAEEMAKRAEALGYTETLVRADLAGRARVLVARTG